MPMQPAVEKRESTPIHNEPKHEFVTAYEAFLERDSPVLKLASMGKVPLRDDFVVTNHITQVTTNSLELNYEQVNSDVMGGLDRLADQIVPGGRAHVYEVSRGKPTKKVVEYYQDVRTFRIHTKNPRIDLVITKTSDDRSHSWDFQLERKPKPLSERITHALTPIFIRSAHPPDRY